MTRPVSPLVHFHSSVTGVSLELPTGFERAGSDESSATYAVLDDTGAAATGDPIVRVQVVGALEATPFDERVAMVTALAEGMAVSGGEVLTRRPGIVDETPVETVVLRRADGVHVHATAIATDDKVLSVVASATDPEWVDTYDAVVESLRFVGADSGSDDAVVGEWSTLTSVDLLVSVRVPTGWEVTEVAETSFTVAGPEAASGHRPVVSVEGGTPGGAGHEWFDEFADAVVPQLRADVPGFEEVGSERFALSSLNADVLLVRARRLGADLSATAQVQAWIWGSSTRMLVVSGSTLLEHEARDLPVFEQIARSVRLLSAPAR